MIVFGGRGILLDVEGTTSSIAFVYDVLFAHAKEQVGAFLAARVDDARVLELAAAIRAGKLSASQAVQDALARIERLNGRLNAFTRVMTDEALCSAEQVDAGNGGFRQ